MTEAEWNICDDPQKMLEWLRATDKLSDRKARLFAVAVCRRVWPSLINERSKRAVEVAEMDADALVLPEELQSACDDAWDHVDSGDGPVTPAEKAAACAAETMSGVIAARDVLTCTSVLKDPCGLLRDLFGNPFRPLPSIDPTWLAWNDGTVRRLSAAIYEDRRLPEGTLDTGRLAVLADALEEAGCTNEEILGHLREPGPHVRGCWPIDLLLDKI